MGFVGCIPRFLKAHGGWILTLLGIGGMGATVILTANEAPDAKQAILDAEEEKISEVYRRYASEEGSLTITDEWNDEHRDEMELTFWEKAKVALPYYWPAIVAGLFSSGCMIGAQIFNVKKQAALISSLAALSTQFEQYREVIRNEYGEEVDKKALAISRERVKELQEEVKRLKEENGPYLYGIATLPGVVFEAKPVDIQESLMHWNRNLILRGENDMDELYEFIGIPDTAYDSAKAASYGYSQYINECDYGIGYVDFQIKQIFSQSGRPVNMIIPSFPPYRVSCVNTSSDDLDYEEDPDYNIDRAIRLAESILNSNQLTKVKHPAIFCGNEYLIT